MEFGRRLSVQEGKTLIADFLKTGHKELDTAYMYSEGQSEKILGDAKELIDEKGGLIATKINPLENAFLMENFREKVETSLSRLERKDVDLLYLHWPCHTHPIKPLLSEIQKLFEAGVFKRFGLSNYQAWEVAKISEYCEKNGFVQPSVYQGMYNCLTRDVERELIPCLRNYNISFYAYNPLAGGLLTGRHKFKDTYESLPEHKCRFYGVGTAAEQAYRDRYWKALYFEAIQAFSSSLPPKTSLLEASFNWLVHHSKLSTEAGDAIIIGASTIEQYRENVAALQHSQPLPKVVVDTVSDSYSRLAGCVPPYYR